MGDFHAAIVRFSLFGLLGDLQICSTPYLVV